ncbi:hypothetical protein, partial [Klebsiella aerogenes]
VLRRSTLTGTTGDLTVESTSGNAVLGEDGAVGIGNDRYFERATGSTGSAHVRGLTGAFVNLDHSATLDQVIA